MRWLQLAEQPRVLDRDDRLVGEVCSSSICALAERLGSVAGDGDGPERRAVFEHRDGERGAYPRLGDRRQSELGIGGNVGDMRDFSRQDRPGCHALSARGQREMLRDAFQFLGRPAVMRSKMDQRSVEPEDAAVDGTANPDGAGGDRIEGWLHVGRGTGDHAQDLRHCRLLFQGLARLVDSRAFSIAMTA